MATPSPRTPKKSTVRSSKGADAPEADALPGPEEIAAAFQPVRDFMQAGTYERVRTSLRRLAQNPPQVLLLEGGTAESRLAAAHCWSLLLNCQDAALPSPQPQRDLGLPGLAPPPAPADASAVSSSELPCLACSECVRMVTHLHRDCFFLDGLSASIKIDDVRAVRAVLGEPPREAQCRMVIFQEAQALVEAAANALLKSFEEPRPGTSFVLLTPQRERLLPTLVSRSFVLTLPWPHMGQETQENEALVSWEAALCVFLQTGQGLFEKTGTRGSVDAPLVHALCAMVRRALAGRILALQSGKPAPEGIESFIGRLPEARMRMLDEVLAECQESLIYGVNPTLVLEWMATRLYLLLPRGRR